MGLRTELNSQNNNHEEIEKRVSVGNRSLHYLGTYAQNYSQKNKKRDYTK